MTTYISLNPYQSPFLPFEGHLEVPHLVILCGCFSATFGGRGGLQAC